MNPHQPIFNAPRVVLGFLLIFAALHALREFLPEADSIWLSAVLGFIPARMTGYAAELPGGEIANLTSFITHQFVHGDVAHLLINSAWLLAFGTPVARRISGVRFTLFFLSTGVAGALLYAAFNPGALTLMVGASGAISGLMGAAFRFLFQVHKHAEAGPVFDLSGQAPLRSLADALRDRRIVMAMLAWTLLNVLLAWGMAGLMDAAGIAWEAHLGGFYAGLLTYGLFEPAPSHSGPDDSAVAG